jgi:hypothetical protein
MRSTLSVPSPKLDSEPRETCVRRLSGELLATRSSPGEVRTQELCADIQGGITLVEQGGEALEHVRDAGRDPKCDRDV